MSSSTYATKLVGFVSLTDDYFTFTSLILVGEYDAIQVIARYATLYFDDEAAVLITASSQYSHDS